MTAPYLGGIAITAYAWEGPFALRVQFTTTYGTSYCYQLYAGRSLVGWTESVSDTEILAQVIPSEWPQHITLLAVDPDERSTDYGADLPPRPYNQVKLEWTTVGWPADTRFCEITASTTPGGAVDLDNVLENMLFDSNGDFLYITDPLAGSGNWPFEISGRDATKPDGNRGTPIAVNADIYAHPPDVEFVDDYNRFTAVSDGVDLTVSFTEPA
jgi:hypothetical protein